MSDQEKSAEQGGAGDEFVWGTFIPSSVGVVFLHADRANAEEQIKKDNAGILVKVASKNAVLIDRKQLADAWAKAHKNEMEMPDSMFYRLAHVLFGMR